MINNKQEGLWITSDTLDYLYTIKGKYSKGLEKGTWRYFKNNKLDRKEKYKKDKCLIKFYHTNGKIMKIGYTKFDKNDKETHWYYNGKWKYYDENNILIRINVFEKGKITDSIIFAKK